LALAVLDTGMASLQRIGGDSSRYIGSSNTDTYSISHDAKLWSILGLGSVFRLGFRVYGKGQI